MHKVFILRLNNIMLFIGDMTTLSLTKTDIKDYFSLYLCWKERLNYSKMKPQFCRLVLKSRHFISNFYIIIYILSYSVTLLEINYFWKLSRAIYYAKLNVPYL